MSLIPATIVTGFLGSGKTTLLNRVLNEAHGQKIAVIENEFGEENIDNEILVQDSKEQIIEMNNGCICCTMRDDLRTHAADLAEKKRKGELDFDRVVIETTGLADPGPVAQTFFMDDEIGDNYLLDSILTLVDAKHADEAARRLPGGAAPDRLRRPDLHQQDRPGRRGRDRSADPTGQAHEPARAAAKVHFGDVPIADVLDLRGFNLNAKLDIDPEFLKADEHDHDTTTHDHDHEHGEHCDHPHHHAHDDDVKSFVFRSDKRLQRRPSSSTSSAASSRSTDRRCCATRACSG